jgi:hypothetical protein
VIRCQLLGPAAHEHSTDYCIFNRPKPIIIEVPIMVQAPVKEDDLPEDEQEESEEE